MTKRIEEIKIGDKFTKGDWTFEVVKTYFKPYPCFEVNLLMDASKYCLDACFTRRDAEAIDTWIEDTSISQAAADEIFSYMDRKGMINMADQICNFVQSLVKK